MSIDSNEKQEVSLIYANIIFRKKKSFDATFYDLKPKIRQI